MGQRRTGVARRVQAREVGVKPDDPITSVVSDGVVHGYFIDYASTIINGFRWGSSGQHLGEDYLSTEGVEWVRGHLIGEDAEALIAAAKLTRSAA